MSSCWWIPPLLWYKGWKTVQLSQEICSTQNLKKCNTCDLFVLVTSEDSELALKIEELFSKSLTPIWNWLTYSIYYGAFHLNILFSGTHIKWSVFCLYWYTDATDGIGTGITNILVMVLELDLWLVIRLGLPNNFRNL